LAYKNPELYKLKKKRHYKRVRDFILSHKKQCAFCGIDDPELLVFHHKDPRTKEYEICDMQTFRAFQNEVDKCVVLCHNCHTRFHQKERRDEITSADIFGFDEEMLENTSKEQINHVFAF